MPNFVTIPQLFFGAQSFTAMSVDKIFKSFNSSTVFSFVNKMLFTNLDDHLASLRITGVFIKSLANVVSSTLVKLYTL